MTIVDNAIYVNGRRAEEPETLEHMYGMLRDQMGMGWLGLYRPEASEIESVAEEFGIHYLAVEDTVRCTSVRNWSGTAMFCSQCSAQPDTWRTKNVLNSAKVHVFTGRDFVVTVRHAESPDLRAVRRRLEGTPELLRLGPEAVLYAILFESSEDEYHPVVDGLQNSIEEIERTKSSRATPQYLEESILSSEKLLSSAVRLDRCCRSSMTSGTVSTSTR